ncbi:MAG TPA: chemotaxis protein CheW, partial [Fibrobacteraceae bacterium]|nr:chemotaxis protein CheW [Fibrobacteraceae bacterium]
VPTNPVTTTLLITLDTIKGLLSDISLEASADVSGDMERLHAILASAEAGTEPAMAFSESTQNSGANPWETSVDREQLDSLRRKGSWVFRFSLDFGDPRVYGYTNGESLLSVLDKTGNILATSQPLPELRNQINNGKTPEGPVGILFATILEPELLRQMLRLPNPEIHVVVSQEAKPQSVPSTSVKPAVVTPLGAAPASESHIHTEPADKIKVSLSVIDNLMTLAGELVLARNQLIQGVGQKDLETIDRSARQLNYITSELQMNIMSTRMQPVGNVFNKFRRIVRDMGQKLNKQVQLVISGEEVELDKSIIESIGDPLTHIVRNSMDHGLEIPSIREAAGKSSVGTLQLVARHEAGMVVLEISDDGAGIDPERVKQKALEKSVVSPQAVEQMSEKEILNLVFLPGFSTADKVTDISGRGVGMDVVRTSFAKLGGSVDIVSHVGKGTTLQIRLPLTLAIIPALMVKSAEMVFAVPQVNLQELVRIAPDQIKKRINRVGDAIFLRLREDLLPLLSIRDILKLTSHFIDPQTGQKEEDRRQFWDRRQPDEETPKSTQEMRQNIQDRRGRVSGSVKIAVVTTGHIRFGLVVDGFLDTEEVVLKPLGSHLKDCRFYAGATILGDGHPALIFDISGIAERWLNIATLQDAREALVKKEAAVPQDVQALIILKGGVQQFYAAPLGLITRIEQVPAKQIEKVGGKMHMQYRNAIMPLYTVDSIANVEPLPEQEDYYVVLFKIQKKEVGLVVAEIVDTVESKASVDQSAYHQNGILGTAIIDNRTTFILDLYGIVISQNPEMGIKSVEVASDGAEDTKVLVVDDSVFFRTQIQTFVEEAGFKTITAEDGVQALDILKSEENKISMILTDIEMPNMDGLEFTRRARELPSYKETPIMAITSLMGSDAEQRGLEAGVNEYQIKLDREKIVERLRFYHKVK